MGILCFPGLRETLEVSPGGFKVVLNRTFLADSLAMGGVFGRVRDRTKCESAGVSSVSLASERPSKHQKRLAGLIFKKIFKRQ